jgi:hypothetical protein
MIWYGMVWCGVVWCGVVWYGIALYSVELYVIMICNGTVWFIKRIGSMKKHKEP